MTQPTSTAPPPAVLPPAADVIGLIGNTPMVEVTRFDVGPCRLFLKLENQNPGGSIKDRIGLSMIRAAERDGRLQPGGTIVEATAGNTGLGLALIAALSGYRLVIVVPDKMAREKVHHLTALGAEVRTTRSDVGKGHPEYYQDMAARIARETGAFHVDQFGNPANPLAHETGTGPEIWRQLDGKVDAVVAGVGSGGTITGLSRFFARVSPATDIVLADPEGSVLARYVQTGQLGEAGSWVVEGIGEDFVPPVADLSRVKVAYTVPDSESLSVARELLRREGILAGSSSGTLIAAALRYCRAQSEPKRVVTFVCDSGAKYLSKQFNDIWMLEQGFAERPPRGDLGDLIPRQHAEGATVTVSPTDTLATAFSRMRGADVSQLPVLEEGRLVGFLDESDLLFHASRSGAGGGHALDGKVAEAMSRDLRTVQASASLDELKALLDQGLVAIVLEGERFLGLITRVDLLNHLRRALP